MKLLASTWKPPQKDELEERVVVPNEEKRAKAAALNIPVLYSKVLWRIEARG